MSGCIGTHKGPSPREELWESREWRERLLAG